jgi:hypothetical protein
MLGVVKLRVVMLNVVAQYTNIRLGWGYFLALNALAYQAKPQPKKCLNKCERSEKELEVNFRLKCQNNFT